MKPLAVCLILFALAASAFTASRAAIADDVPAMLRWGAWTLAALLAAMVFPLFT